MRTAKLRNMRLLLAPTLLCAIILLFTGCGGGAEVAASNTAPTISLNGDESVTVPLGGSFTDPGVTANDAEDGSLTSSVVSSSNVDFNTPGSYEITYTVTDSDGSSTSITREVIVSSNANNQPQVSLTGPGSIEVKFGEAFEDPGATASDAEDGNLSANIIVETNLDTRFPGEYQITYRVTDSSNASAQVSRTVVVLEALAETLADTSRFLQRASFGQKPADTQALMDKSYREWIDQQISLPATLQLPELVRRMNEFGFNTNDILLSGSAYQAHLLRNDAWLDAVINQEDQLRQRVAFALSQIFVVSTRDNAVNQRAQGLANYNDILVRNAFGNFRDLLGEVTLSPIMGHYLSMRRNEKANDDENILPDENFAREVMQLFTIGLDLLNIDGSVQRNSQNQAIPAYTQDDILNFARVFTGWNYGDSISMRSNSRTLQSELIPMKAFEQYHDDQPKTLLLGEQLSGGLTAAEDLDIALDNLFNHPNVGPFFGKQLIQKLVTSNPSPQYIERVATVFNDNGDGVRGDLEATVKAVLLDPEALLGYREAPTTFGKLKEPLMKLIQVWRAFEADGVVPDRIRFSNTDSSLGQQHLRSPSVFNFFQPDFSQPGLIRDAGLVSPEFQILNESQAVNLHNELYQAARSAPFRNDTDNASKNQIILNIEFEKTLADNPTALVDHLIDKLIGSEIDADNRAAMIAQVEARALNDDGKNRVEDALYLVLVSPEYSIQR